MLETVKISEKTDKKVPFALMYVVFDEIEGPVLRKLLLHEISFPTVILRGVTTTLFTMSVGIGEPEGEHETAIIPISVTSAKGRVLIYSYGVPDASMRGGKKIESVMLFVDREYQERFLKYTLSIVNVIDEAVKSVTAPTKPKNFDEAFDTAFNNIRRILHTEIDPDVQARLSHICTDTEMGLISDGTIKAIVNAEVTSMLTESLAPIHHSLEQLREFRKQLIDEIKTQEKLQQVFESVPSSSYATNLEIHGKTIGGIAFYSIYRKGFFETITSKRRGIIGRLMRPLREIADIVSHGYYPTYQKEDLSSILPNNYESIVADNELDEIFKKLSVVEPNFSNMQLLSFSNNEITHFSAMHKNKLLLGYAAAIIHLFELLSSYCEILTGEKLKGIILADPVMNTMIRPVKSLNKNRKLYFVGDSQKNIGFLRLTEVEINRLVVA